jgi:hypothetical protein
MNGSGSSAAVYKSVTVYETPEVTFSGGGLFCQGSATNLSASPTMNAASSTLSYGWTPSTGIQGPGNTLTISVMPQSSTVYTLSLQLGPCRNQVTYFVDITSCVGLNKEDAINNLLAIFPNPSNGNFTITSDRSENVDIINQNGQLVRRIYIVSNVKAVLSDLPAGVYYAVSGTRKLKFIVSGH